jgi:hypothetical protein
MRSRILLVAGIALACLTACQSLLGTDNLDPSDFEFAERVAYACGSWNPAQPDVELGLFDVLWGGSGESPMGRQRARVVDLGGKVVHAFHVPMLRILIPPEQVPELDANLVKGVPSAGQYLVRLFITFDEPLARQDFELIEALGGRVETWYKSVPTVLAVVPDSKVPFLRRWHRVQFVEPVGIGCPLN